MGYGFKHGGGGSANLNFKIVGGTSQPSSPSENTIWVNTSVPINAYYFSATQPTGITAGDVWIYTGTTSAAAFNALKKNGIMVYPLSAKQYVSGAWVSKTAMSYQGGEWNPWWSGDIYNAGDENTAITGGIKIYTGSSYVKKNTADIQFTAAASTAGISTVDAVDLSGYSTLNASITGCTAGASSAPNMYLGYCAPAAPTTPVGRASKSNASGSFTMTCDISGVTGLHYVVIAAYQQGFKVTRIWLN